MTHENNLGLIDIKTGLYYHVTHNMQI